MPDCHSNNIDILFFEQLTNLITLTKEKQGMVLLWNEVAVGIQLRLVKSFFVCQRTIVPRPEELRTFSFIFLVQLILFNHPQTGKFP